jgi:mandelate racemase
MTTQIRSLRVRAVNVPLEYPIKTAVGLLGSAPLVLIDLETDDHVTGCAYLFAYIRPALKPLAQAVQELGEIVVGQPLAPIAIDQLIEQRLRLVGHTGLLRMASAGIDMAAWDALAKSHGLPLCELLGGEVKSIRAYDSHSMDGIELAAKRAALAAERGFTAMKTKIGYATVEEDLAVLKAIRAATGHQMSIMADYNQSLDVPEAIRRGRILDQENLLWVEEPTLEGDYHGHARIGASIRTPVQMGENWLGVNEMSRALDAGACSFGMLDIMKIGGVTGWLRASSLALLQGLPLSSHIFQEFSAHLLAATPTAHWLERLDIARPIVAPDLAFKDGKAVIPDLPGSGISWIESKVAEYEI